MKTMTARELKNHTGDVMRAISKGEEVVVTLRGMPAALILPYMESKKKEALKLRPYKKAWEDIEKSLNKTEPEYKTWQEAVGWSRKRI